jgi:hypothetical protein
MFEMCLLIRGKQAEGSVQLILSGSSTLVEPFDRMNDTTKFID